MYTFLKGWHSFLPSAEKHTMVWKLHTFVMTGSVMITLSISQLCSARLQQGGSPFSTEHSLCMYLINAYLRGAGGAFL